MIDPNAPLWKIYKITNFTNGKIYIGMTRLSLHKRWIKHVADSRKPNINRGMPNAIRKYGEAAFTIDLVLDGLTFAEASLTERDMIRSHNSIKPNGYNISPGGDSFSGKWHSEETRRRMSESHMGRPLSPQTREALRRANTGRRQSDEERAKKSQAMTGKIHSEERRKQISERLREIWEKRRLGLISPRKRRAPFSPEARKRMSDAQKRVQAETEQLAAFSRSRRGIPKSAEHRAAIGAALKASPKAIAQRARAIEVLHEANRIRRSIS